MYNILNELVKIKQELDTTVIFNESGMNKEASLCLEVASILTQRLIGQISNESK